MSYFGLPAEPEKLEQAREAGVERCVLGLPAAEPDEVRRLIDRYAELLSG